MWNRNCGSVHCDMRSNAVLGRSGGGFSKKQYASIADSELAMKVLKEGD